MNKHIFLLILSKQCETLVTVDPINKFSIVVLGLSLSPQRTHVTPLSSVSLLYELEALRNRDGRRPALEDDGRLDKVFPHPHYYPNFLPDELSSSLFNSPFLLVLPFSIFLSLSFFFLPLLFFIFFLFLSLPFFLLFQLLFRLLLLFLFILLFFCSLTFFLFLLLLAPPSPFALSLSTYHSIYFQSTL